MSLYANMSIAGLVVNDTNPIALNADGNTLTIGTGGITVNNTAGNPSVSIATPVALNGTQTWTNNSTNALTVSGIISGSSALTTTGSGTIVLSAQIVLLAPQRSAAGPYKSALAASLTTPRRSTSAARRHRRSPSREDRSRAARSM